MPCDHHKQSIINQIVDGIDDKEEEEASDSENDYIDDDLRGNFFDDLEHISSPFTSWLTQIVEEADQTVKADDDGKYDNVMYNEAFAKDFIRLCKLLPLWSAISCDIFGIPEPTFSSSNVECEFKNLKQALDEIIPCSIDTLVQEHIEWMNGQVLEASHDQKYIKFIGGHNLSDIESNNSSNEYSDDRKAFTKHPSDSIETGDESTDEIDASNKCPACKNNHQPDGAHTCIECKKPIITHYLDVLFHVVMKKDMGSYESVCHAQEKYVLRFAIEMCRKLQRK